MRKQQKKDLKYYNSLQPPLLMQGFELQETDIIAPIVTDRKVFTTRVNRGIVNYVDFQVLAIGQIGNGLRETDYNATQISITGGGQEIIKDEPSERYNYALDLGDKKEQKIPIILNGGQQIISKFFLPDLVSNQLSFRILGQLLLHYTTKRHDEWVKKFAKFGQGLGLKRQSFRLRVPVGTPTGGISISDTIPKNQGEIIGFSFLYLGTNFENEVVNFSVDNLGLIEGVSPMRFSRFCQRDPLIFWQELNPGSVFKLELFEAVQTVSLSQIWLTLYFNN